MPSRYLPRVLAAKLACLSLMGNAKVMAQPIMLDNLCNEPAVYLNTTGAGDVLILGNSSPEARYVVVIPGSDLEVLTQVQQCVADAFITDSRLGAYIHVGAFSTRSDAEMVVLRLRSKNLSARVAYF